VNSIVVLISGQGSNCVALIDACQRERWPARVTAVISNKASAMGLTRAAEAGVATEVLEAKGFADRASYDQALMECIDRHGADLVLLAGFMRILSADFVDHYAGRMMNIHPSLLPSFTGLHTHQRALEAGVKVHGATVHFVTAELDAGPIVVQAAVPVHPDDDEERLAERVLKMEHRIYPMAARWFVEGRLHVDNARVRLDGAAEPLQLGLGH
jgi:phosphoribosylglycinamide formyltransferase-1